MTGNHKQEELTSADYDRVWAKDEIPFIDSAEGLASLADTFGLRSDWHEPDESDVLEAEILRLGREGSAKRVREHRFGKNVEIQGTLKGPNGKELPVKTVWLVPKLRSPARFVTLIPDP